MIQDASWQIHDFSLRWRIQRGLHFTSDQSSPLTYQFIWVVLTGEALRSSFPILAQSFLFHDNKAIGNYIKWKVLVKSLTFTPFFPITHMT